MQMENELTRNSVMNGTIGLEPSRSEQLPDGNVLESRERSVLNRPGGGEKGVSIKIMEQTPEL
jgi:hypothetical protein